MHCKLYPAHTWVIPPKHSVCDYSTSHLHISEEGNTMHCGWWFLFARRDAGNTYHVTEWYFCFIKIIGHSFFLADCNTAAVSIFRLGLPFCSFSDASPNSVFSHESRKLTLYIPPTKTFWTRTFNSYQKNIDNTQLTVQQNKPLN